MGQAAAILLSILRCVETWLQIKLRRLILDEKERCDAEMEEIGDRVLELRRACRDADAKRLLQREAERLAFREFCFGRLSLLERRGAGGDETRNVPPAA